MADVTWPYLSLQPNNVSVDVRAYSLSGGRSLSGIEQVMMADAGYWEITLEDIPIRSNADVLRWRTIESGLGGRARTCLVPAYDRKRAPLPIGGGAVSASMSGAVAANEVSANIEVATGTELLPGMHFSVAERFYRLKYVGTPSGSPPVYPVKFWPPAREAIADMAALEFDHPVCRCRLKDDHGMDSTLELLKFSTPSVEFCEDV